MQPHMGLWGHGQTPTRYRYGSPNGLGRLVRQNLPPLTHSDTIIPARGCISVGKRVPMQGSLHPR
jgi:hypothetical protein